MLEEPEHGRYENWRDEAVGEYAGAATQRLLRQLLSGWPRRSRSVLVFNSGGAAGGVGYSGETLWDAGLAVTVQDSDPEWLSRARGRLGNRAEYVLGAPEHLPFDDGAFDYAVAVAAVEFWKNPEDVLREIDRLTCSGAVFIIPNAWSVFSLECRLRRKTPLCRSARPLFISPRRLHRMARAAFPAACLSWMSVLPGPSLCWRPNVWRMFSGVLPLPVGAFAGLRVDFGPLYTGTPLLLPSSLSVRRAGSGASKGAIRNMSPRGES